MFVVAAAAIIYCAGLMDLPDNALVRIYLLKHNDSDPKNGGDEALQRPWKVAVGTQIE